MYINSDIIVWNNVVGSYGALKPLIESDDEVVLASPDDIGRYKQINGYLK